MLPVGIQNGYLKNCVCIYIYMCVWNLYIDLYGFCMCIYIYVEPLYRFIWILYVYTYIYIYICGTFI